MGAQRLSARSVRRIMRRTGLNDIMAGWAYGHTQYFVTSAHQHGWWDPKTGSWGWEVDQKRAHHEVCSALFPHYWEGT